MKIRQMILTGMLLLALVVPAQEQNTLTSRQTGADSTVLVVPFRELAVQRIDALIDDSLMETTQLGLMVWDLTTDSLLYAYNPRHLLRPASTMKLLTAITALERLGTDHRFSTSLYYKGTIEQGTLRGDLYCRGGMDPMFDRNDMRAMVQALKSKGIRSFKGRIVTDCSMKESEKWGEGWCWDDKSPVLSALLIDGKANFSERLNNELRSLRLTTTGVSVVTGTVPADAHLVCTRTHTLSQVLQQMMKESDNLYAESTFYQVAASTGHRPATAHDAQEVEKGMLEKMGLDPTRYNVADGSGLSLYNYLTAEAQVMLLRYAWQRPQLYSQLIVTLPIAGEDGTLKNRMKDTPAKGNVKAKTGTLTGISSLAGYLTAPNGHLLCFSIINQGVRRAAEGRAFQDRLCLALCQP